MVQAVVVLVIVEVAAVATTATVAPSQREKGALKVRVSNRRQQQHFAGAWTINLSVGRSFVSSVGRSDSV